MGGHDGDMRAAARRDPDFRGIDPADLARLVKAMQDAGRQVSGWLAGHRPPPGVPATAYRQAADAAAWGDQQVGMLSRRHSYAVTHPDAADGVTAPAPPTKTPAPGASPEPGGPPGKGVPVPASPSPPRDRRPATPRPDDPGTRPGGPPSTPGAPPRTPGSRPAPPGGAGPDLGNFPDRRSAEKAARADALAIERALRSGAPVPEQVWRDVLANADDPDYATALVSRLRAQGIARLLTALPDDERERAQRQQALSESIGVASHHIVIGERWFGALLAEAGREGVRDTAVHVITHARLSERSREALAGLGPLPGNGDGGGNANGGGDCEQRAVAAKAPATAR